MIISLVVIIQVTKPDKSVESMEFSQSESEVDTEGNTNKGARGHKRKNDDTLPATQEKKAKMTKEVVESEVSQVIRPSSKVVPVDTSNWKFVTSNLIPSERKTVPEFISSLNCKGLVGKMDDSVTHVIVTTEESFEAKRTLKYLKGVACGLMIVSHLWSEACLMDKSNIARAEQWEVPDEELEGENVP